MSKAFTKENDSLEAPEIEEPRLPPHTKNYITPQGASKLRTELKQLVETQRPKVVETVAWAAKNGDRSENGDYIYGKRRLREIDRRIRLLTKRLEIAEIVDPSQTKSEQVRFGATVTLVDDHGDRKIYSIVGIDETNIGNGLISWISPLGRGLLGHRTGDSVTIRTPQGETEVKILVIEFKTIG